VPVGNGLTMDFGKFASSIGIEGNYTKDQINYSRSYWFNLLPFYHFGFRINYNFNDLLSGGYWLVNGIGQSEDFNQNKSQNLTFSVKPSKTASWTWNYYAGVETPEIVGKQAPGGRTHIIDTYFSWDLSKRLTLAAEADYLIRRFQTSDPPSHVGGGAGYLRYQFASKFALAGRAEYLSDRGGIFSGFTQTLKETTLTVDYRAADGFLVRGEWRRDFSNQPFFLTSAPGLLKKEQNTATLGLTWWFGRKGGAW